MYSQDMACYGYYLPKPLESVFTVGWLAADKTYEVGVLRAELIERLLKVMALTGATNVHVNRIRSIHPCNLCGTDSFNDVDPDGSKLVGASEIWIPRLGGGFFAAPSMLIHYVVEHKYLPPAEFCDALMAFDVSKPFSAQVEYEKLASAAMS